MDDLYCPYCNHIKRNWMVDTDVNTLECSECGEEFKVIIDKIYIVNTEKMEDK